MTTTTTPPRTPSPTELAKEKQRATEALAALDPEKLPPILRGYAPAEIEMAKRTIAKDATTDELGFFLSFCKARDLDPWAKEVYFVKRVSSKGEVSLSFQTSIDGMRIASRKGDSIEWMEGPMWCGTDGKWLDVWLAKTPPAAARFVVKIKGQEKPITGTALFSEYAQTTYQGDLTRMWATMPAGQIAKCAEALTLRRALPKELGGVHIDDEMHQADNVERLPPGAAAPPALEAAKVSRSDDLKARLATTPALPAATTTAVKVPDAVEEPAPVPAKAVEKVPAGVSPILDVHGVTAPPAPAPAPSSPPPASTPAPEPAPEAAAEGCDPVQAQMIKALLGDLDVNGKEARASFLGHTLATINEGKGIARPGVVPPLEKLSTLTKQQADEVIAALNAEIQAKQQIEEGGSAEPPPESESAEDVDGPPGGDA